MVSTTESVSRPSGSAIRRFFLAALCLAVLSGCAVFPRTHTPSSRDAPREAGALERELALVFEAGEYEAADSLAREILRMYPGYARNDEVLYVASQASHARDAHAQTVKYAEELSAKYPLSPVREKALLLEADAFAELERYYESADVLSRLLALPLERDVQERCVEDLRRLVENDLGAAELERLVQAHPSSPLASETSLGLARREFARGNYESSYRLLADLLYQFPEHSEAREIRYLLEVSANRMHDPGRVVTHVVPNKIGILLPYTGEYSRFGRYFEEGVRLAVEEYNTSAAAKVTLVLGDSKADPITAVKAVRKLAVEEGVIAVVGCVFTVPSIAAATECNAWKVPIVSPMVRDAGLRDIGPWVFLTQMPVEVEVAAVAAVAVEGMLLERIAVLAPSTPDGERLARLFVEEVTRRGGGVVIQESFALGDSDFREPLGKIREAAPDAIFIPGAPDELVSILPQIRFFDLQVQLLGLSSWNSERLFRLAGRDLEGAVFPREGHTRTDREAYARFAARYLEANAGEGSPSSAGDVSPVVAAGYFGCRFVIDALAQGAVDRSGVRESLEAVLTPSAGVRVEQVESLPLLRVVSGRAVEFDGSRREPR